MKRKKGDVSAAALKILQEALDCDQQAIQPLMLTEFKCNKTLANHPKIPVKEVPVVSTHKKETYIRVIGLLNGILEELGEPKIAQREDAETGLIENFELFKGG